MQTKTTDPYGYGVVYKKNLSQYHVHTNGWVIKCSLSAKLWKNFETSGGKGGRKTRVTNTREKHMDPVAIGDRVRYQTADADTGMILEVLPRQNKLTRQSAKPMPGAHAFEQVIAANLDQVVPVFAAANPEPHWHMLDRYLVAAEYHELPVRIAITKMDLVRNTPAEAELLEAVERYRQIGYPVTLTSAQEDLGLEELREILTGKTSVLVGKSGVGKTSLLNAIEPGLGLRVHTVNETTGKGRHTTTHLEMFPLAASGAIIDTPGVREFGLIGLTSEDVAGCFPEMRPLLGQCQFGHSCRHEDEPGCAIRQAVMEGAISPYRYKSYLRLKVDL
nr:ribosome small subunit-dependent GTPase A [uncultured Hyphomonas sp.]